MNTERLNKLLRELNDRDPLKRRSAADALSRSDARAVYPLILALRDDNRGVQDAAIQSLMSLKDEVTAYMLLPLLRENSFLRNTALLILKDLGTVTVPLLSPLLDDRDDDVRKFALDLIHDIRYCSYPEKVVSILVKDKNANIRAAAAKTLGALQYSSAVPELIKSLEDEEWVCFSAIEALTELKDERAVPFIIRLMESPHRTLRCAAIESLGTLGDVRAVQPLTNYLRTADDSEKNAVTKSLVKIGEIPSLPEVTDSLLRMMQEDDWEERLIAIKGLSALSYNGLLPSLFDLAGSLDLTFPDNEDRLREIKEIIYRYGCTSSLIDFLNDASVKYRGKVVAAEVAGTLKCREAVESLVTLLDSNSRDVRRSSIESLAQINSVKSKPYLREAITDEDSHVRKSAVIALGKLGDRHSFEPLFSTLQNEKYADVADEIIHALMSIDSSLFLSRLKDLNGDIGRMVLRYKGLADSGVCH